MVHNNHVIWWCGVNNFQSTLRGQTALDCWYEMLPHSGYENTTNLNKIGGIVYMASLIGFLLLLLIHLTRFALNPRVLPASITHQSEGLFVSTFAAAMGILIIDGATYSEKMHTTHGMALRAFYWIFVGVAVLFGVATPLVQ
jgi:tellurite resistance protein TehA-like permease